MMRVELIMFICFFQHVNGVYWTSWKDKDNPSGGGDDETIGRGPKPCGRNNALKIQAWDGKGGAITAEDTITVGPAYGLYCAGSSCKDYRVSYGMWVVDSPKWYSEWYDASTPGFSDNERISKHGPLNKYAFLIEIRYQIVGSSSTSYVTHKIVLGPKYGLLCETAGQQSFMSVCPDYHVRYQCPGIAPFIRTNG